MGCVHRSADVRIEARLGDWLHLSLTSRCSRHVNRYRKCGVTAEESQARAMEKPT